MINHKYKCLFVHIPKTAGSSIRHILPPSDESKFACGHADAMTYYGFFHGSDYRVKDPLGREKWEEYMKFAFVRNPWDRFVSAYRYLKNGGNDSCESAAVKRVLIDKCSCIKEFICNEEIMNGDILNGSGDLIDQGICYRVYHFKSQHQMLKHTVSNQILIDNIYRFEALQEGIDDIFKKIGIPQQPLPHFKKNREEMDYTDYYDKETREIIAAKYKEDIELFGYEFGK